MIQQIGAGRFHSNFALKERNVAQPAKASTNYATPTFSQNYTATSLINAYQAFHGIQTARTVSFGKSLSTALQGLKKQMVTCQDKSKGKDGEAVGSRSNINEIVDKFHKDLPNAHDAVKTNVLISEDKEKGKMTENFIEL